MSQCEAAESSSQVKPQVIDGKERSSLDEVLRQGARQMLVKAVEAEVTAYIQAHQHEVDEDGRRLVVRNGHARERTLVSGAGQLKILGAVSPIPLCSVSCRWTRELSVHKYGKRHSTLVWES